MTDVFPLPFSHTRAPPHSRSFDIQRRPLAEVVIPARSSSSSSSTDRFRRTTEGCEQSSEIASSDRLLLVIQSHAVHDPGDPVHQRLRFLARRPLPVIIDAGTEIICPRIPIDDEGVERAGAKSASSRVAAVQTREFDREVAQMRGSVEGKTKQVAFEPGTLRARTDVEFEVIASPEDCGGFLADLAADAEDPDVDAAEFSPVPEVGFFVLGQAFAVDAITHLRWQVKQW